MYASIVVCVAIAVVGIHGHTVLLPEAQKVKAAEYVNDCVKQTGVNPELIADAQKGQFSEDDTLKKFTLCFFEKASIVDHDGNLNVANAVAKLPPGLDKGDAQKVLESCKDKTGKDAAEKAFEIFKCYHQGTKHHVGLGI